MDLERDAIYMLLNVFLESIHTGGIRKLSLNLMVCGLLEWGRASEIGNF